jgi:phage gp36-like protein
MEVSNQYVSNKGVELLTQIRQEAQDNGVTDMTLDEINAEIQAYKNRYRNPIRLKSKKLSEYCKLRIVKRISNNTRN